MNEYICQTLNSLHFPLVKKLYKTHYTAGMPKKDEIIWTIKKDNEILGAVRFRQHIDYQLLTGMLIVPNFRNKGLAGYLLAATKPQLQRKISYCFSFQHITSLYLSAGFKIIEPEKLPNDLYCKLLRYQQSGKNLVPMQFDMHS